MRLTDLKCVLETPEPVAARNDFRPYDVPIPRSSTLRCGFRGRRRENTSREGRIEMMGLRAELGVCIQIRASDERDRNNTLCAHEANEMITNL